MVKRRGKYLYRDRVVHLFQLNTMLKSRKVLMDQLARESLKEDVFHGLSSDSCVSGSGQETRFEAEAPYDHLGHIVKEE